LISCFLITLYGSPLVITFYSCMAICQSSSFKDLSVLCFFVSVRKKMSAIQKRVQVCFWKIFVIDLQFKKKIFRN